MMPWQTDHKVRILRVLQWRVGLIVNAGSSEKLVVMRV